MKKLNNFEKKLSFEPITNKSFDELNDGYYILKAIEGTPVIDGATGEIDRNMIGIKSDYYLFEMNDDYRGDEKATKSVKDYHQLNIKNLTEEEYIEYMNSEN